MNRAFLALDQESIASILQEIYEKSLVDETLKAHEVVDEMVKRLRAVLMVTPL